MAFELPPLPFPKEPGTNNPYIATPDEGGGYTVPSGHYFKKKVGDLHLWIPVSESDPLPTKSTNADAALSALRDSLLGSGNKTLSDLATALEPLATNEKQVELVSALGAIADAAVSDPAVSGTVVSLLKGLLSQLQAGSPVSVTESSLPAGAATDVEIQTLQEKVDALNTKIDAIMDGTTPAKTQLTGSPDGQPISTTEGKLAVRAAELEAKIEAVRVLLNALAGEDFATQTTLAQILNKMIAAPATEAKQDTLNTKIDEIVTDGVKLKGSLIADEDALPVKQMPSTVTEDIINKQADIYSSINILIEQNVSPEIYGAKWNKGEIPTLTRTDAAVEKVANVGVDFEPASNDFDDLPIWGEIEEAVDDYGNVYMRIPKFYIRKLDGENFKSWQVSKRRHPGFYLPWCFWDFARKRELPYLDFGKHNASLGMEDKLESKPGKYPLVGKSIVSFRTYAQNNGAGYQQLDLHAVDMLRTLMFIEFATLNMQSVMQGFVNGRNHASDVVTVAEVGTNRAIVANATASNFEAGQPIAVSDRPDALWRLPSVFYGRTITSIEPYDAENTAIYFDGDPVNIAAGNVVLNTGWKSGFSNQIMASSGSIVSNSDGKHPCVYRGIENPYGNIWQFTDGVNITDHQAWVCKNADNYASNVFANPYEQLGYMNASENGYVKEMGHDPDFPFAELPTAVGGSASTYYSDYYYQNTGARVARFGGYWPEGLGAGPSFWNLDLSSGGAGVVCGGRLLKKPL
jgi:hypothetical protein